jgi:hypothetical protein
VAGQRRVLAMKRRERVALLLSPVLRAVARHVQAARSALEAVPIDGNVVEAKAEIDEALDLLLGKSRAR